MAYFTYNLYAVPGLADTESLSRQYLLVTFRMEFRETDTELEFATVYIDCPVGFLLSLHRILRQAFGIDAEEVAHTGFLQFQISGHPVKTHYMDDVLLYRTENPL